MEVNINVLDVKRESDDHGRPWYNVCVELSIGGRRSVSGLVSLGSDLKPMGDSAQAWLSRTLYSEMVHLSGPQFADVADQIEDVVADVARAYADE